jgi:hypothetical protein
MTPAGCARADFHAPPEFYFPPRFVSILPHIPNRRMNRRICVICVNGAPPPSIPTDGLMIFPNGSLCVCVVFLRCLFLFSNNRVRRVSLSASVAYRFRRFAFKFFRLCSRRIRLLSFRVSLLFAFSRRSPWFEFRFFHISLGVFAFRLFRISLGVFAFRIPLLLHYVWRFCIPFLLHFVGRFRFAFCWALSLPEQQQKQNKILHFWVHVGDHNRSPSLVPD